VTTSGGTGCLPGDITLTPVHGGFMLGRVLPQRGPGPWWEYIKVVADRAAAISEARRLAIAPKTRLWYHEGGDLTRAVPLEGPIDSDAPETR
jgi:hypothetical protein